MALTEDPSLPSWFKTHGFEDYSEILTQELGVEEYDDFRLLRDERDVNELLSDMSALRAMSDDFRARFKAQMMHILKSTPPPRPKTQTQPATQPRSESKTKTKSKSKSKSKSSPKKTAKPTVTPKHLQKAASYDPGVTKTK